MLEFILDKIDAYLKAGFTKSEHGLLLVFKVRMYNAGANVAILVSVSLGIFALVQNYFMLAIADLIFATSLILQTIYLRRTKKYYNVAITSAIFVGFFYLFLLTSGGVNNTASLWLYTYPLVTFSLLDSKNGLYSNTTMLILVSLFFFVFQYECDCFATYQMDYILRFIPSYLVVSLYSYLFTSNREESFSMLENKNAELKVIINELEIKKENLIQLSNDLEKRVERRTAELNIAKKDAENSEKIKTEFLAQMSHEIRSPLNVVMSFIELIKHEVEDTISEDMKVSFQSIESASTRIIRTIDLILNMTDLQLGSYEITVSKIDVSEMLNRGKNEYLQSANNKNLELSLELELNKKNIMSDEYALSQVISNLVDNAIKYTSTGFVKISTMEDENNILNIIVEDSGIGMREEFLPSLFNSFTQEEQGYSRSYDGNGLGMSLVKKYCDLISAKISVESQKGKGSTFTLVIPNLN